MAQGRSRRASLLQFLALVRGRFLERRVLQTAGSLTYTTLLSLVPMVTVVIGVMRQFKPFAQFGDDMRAFLLQNLLPERAGKMIATYALQFSQKASSLTLVGTMFLVVTAIMLFQTIDHTLNGIWNVRRPRVWYVRLPVYWLALTLGPVIFAASVAVTGELLTISRDLVDEHSHSRWLDVLMDRSMTTLLLSALFCFMFHAIPNRRLNIWHSVVGGLVAGVGVVLSQRLFGFYLSKLPSFTLIYGTFSVLPIFLIWVYLSWLMVLLGATISAVLPDFSLRHTQLPETGAGRVLAAVRLARALAQGQREGRALELTELAKESHQTMASADEMLETLRGAGWVVRTEEGGWMLCVAAEKLSVGELLAHTTFDSAQARLLVGEDAALALSLRGAVQEGLNRPVVELGA